MNRNFNGDELLLQARSNPENFTKEGILFAKNTDLKSKKKNKSSGSWSERWFCLKSNLLFCMKGVDRLSTCSHVIVLERCTVELDSEDESPDYFVFIICPAGSNEVIHLAAKSEQERESWVSHLHTASYECMKMQVEALREQLTSRTGHDPVTCGLPLADLKPISETDDPSIEIGLSCSSLVVEGNDAPNTVIDILILSDINWNKIAQTEVVEDSHSPIFMKTIGLGEYSSKTRIKLMVYNIQHIETGWRSLIGYAHFLLQELLTSNKLNLSITSAEGASVGSITIMPWWNRGVPDSPASLVSSGAPSYSHADNMAFRTRKQNQLHSLFTKSVSKMFRFPTSNGEQLSVTEVMAESKITFLFSIAYMNFVMKETNQWIDQLKNLPFISREVDHQKALCLERASSLSQYLRVNIQTLERKYSGQTFKPSRSKAERDLEFIPTNLHINRLLVTNEQSLHIDEVTALNTGSEIGAGGSYDIISVGAFSAHSFGYKQGGLHRLLKDDTSSHHLKLDRLVRQSMSLAQLKQSLSHTCDGIVNAAASQDFSLLSSFTRNLKQQSMIFEDICTKEPIVNSAMSAVTSMAKVHRQNHQHPNNNVEDDCDEQISMNISQDSWRFALNNHRQSVSSLVAACEACLDSVPPKLWLERLSVTKMSCEAFLEKTSTYVSAALAHAQLDIKLHSGFFTDPALERRYHAVIGQAITAALTGIISKIRFNITNTEFMSQMADIGLLLNFEGLLSCHKSEQAMIEDFMVGVEFLDSVRFVLVESSSSNDDYAHNLPLISGTVYRPEVKIPIPSAVFPLIPSSLSIEGFRVVPVLFNIGINELATLAERIGSTALQEQLNIRSCDRLVEYFKEYRSMELRSPREAQALPQGAPALYALEELIRRLQGYVHESRRKHVEVIQLSSEICRRLNSVRFTSCKSAKDRTAMSLTLEECKILQEEHKLSPDRFGKALDCLRSEGVRRDNSYKNTEIMSYSFSSIQLLTFPRLYKPPAGTYGKGES